MVYSRNTPRWVMNRIPTHLGPRVQAEMKRELLKEYRELTPEERRATEVPTWK